MWKLTIEDDEGKQTSLPLAHEEYGLGRAEANAIRLTDRNVSRKHAVLRRNGAGWYLNDLASYNGTYINGVRVVQEQLIQSGDIVQLGDYRLELLDEAQALAPSPDAPVQAASTTGPVQRPDRLVVVVGPQPGQEFPLDKEHFTIGRSEEATISINHSSVSRIHAEIIALGGGRYEVLDTGSANGIRVNGVELKRSMLEAGDALELGDVRLRFVGAGKIYRTGADQSQQLAAVPAAVAAFESVAPSVRAPAPPPRGGVGIGKLVGIGAFVGVVLIVVFLIVSRTGNTSTTDPPQKPVPAPTTTDAAKILKDASDKLANKDYDGAHQKALEIPEGSPLRNDPEFKQIEAAWADSVFRQIEATNVLDDKRKLLNTIWQALTVDRERRNKALEMIEQLNAADPTASAMPTDAPQYPRPPGTQGSTTSGSPATTRTSEPTPSTAPTGDVGNSEAVIRNLSGKVWSGRASVEEMRILRAACKHVHDYACRDRVDALLKKATSSTP